MLWLWLFIGLLVGAVSEQVLAGVALGALVWVGGRLKQLAAANAALERQVDELEQKVARGAWSVAARPEPAPEPAPSWSNVAAGRSGAFTPRRRETTEPRPVAQPTVFADAAPPIVPADAAPPMATTDAPTFIAPVMDAAPFTSPFTSPFTEAVPLASPVPDAQPFVIAPVEVPSFAGVDPTAAPGFAFAAAVGPAPAFPVDDEPAPVFVEPAPAEIIVPPIAHTPGPPEPVEPPRVDLIEQLVATVRGWLFGGNPVLRIGVLLLFLGLAFLLRYASERGMVPIELRYAGVAGAALTLLGLGWWLRRRNEAYALILQGTGIAVLYLTVFAAIRLHTLLPATPGFVMLVVIMIASAILAVVQNARGLAVVATIGGFAAPVLASTGGGNHVALFTYFAVLNTGIFAIAWYRAWRLLNMIGFVGTFGIGLAWGLRSYTPALFATTEPFLVLFFLMYIGIGLLFARRTLLDAADAPAERDALLRWSARQTDYVDGTVMFGPPMVGFGLQYAVVSHLELGAAFSAAALGLFYMTLARLLAGRSAGKVLLLVEVYLALGVVFGTLALPLGLDARWTSAAWAVEGAGLYWLGLRQRRPLARAFALVVQTGAAIAYLGELQPGDAHTLLRGAPLGALMLGAALLFAHDRLRRAPDDAVAPWERHFLPLFACTGLAFMYLIAPLLLRVDGTAISWAVAGLVTLFVGLRLRSRSYVLMALGVQVVGGALFLLDVRGSGSAHVVFAAGWRGLMTASWIGVALLAGVVIAARDPLIRDDRRLLAALTIILLLGLGFLNLGVLFVLPFTVAAAVWGASGLVIMWLSLRLQQRASFVFGLLLQAFGGAAFLLTGPELLATVHGAGLRPLLHPGFYTPAVLALAALIGAWRLHRAAADAVTHVSTDDTSTDPPPTLPIGALAELSHLLLLWGGAWWGLTALCEVWRFVPVPLRSAALLAIAAVSAGLFTIVALRARWPAMALLALTLTPVGVTVLATLWRPDVHPLGSFAWVGWTALLGVHLLSLRRLAALLPGVIVGGAHVLGCWLVLAVLALETRFLMLRLADHDNAWRWLGWALVPSLYLLVMASRRALVWPVSAYPREYRGIAALPVAVLLLGWFWTANALGDGDAAPLTYIPLINPLELGLLIALFAVLRWLMTGLPRLGATVVDLPLRAIVGTSLFALLTAGVFRTAHHWAGEPYRLEPLLASMLVQAGLSIVWTLVALGLMISGHLHRRRVRWTVGAALIGVVVVKLFLVELGNSGGLARIISFIGVGVLLLIVGYFAPLPPRAAAPIEEES